MPTIIHIKLAAHFAPLERCFLEVLQAENLDQLFLDLWVECLWPGASLGVLIINKYICVNNSSIKLKRESSLLYILMGEYKYESVFR